MTGSVGGTKVVRRILCVAIGMMLWAGSLSAQSLIAHYPLDGHTNDVSGQGFHGTPDGSVAWGTGHLDGALVLTGSGAVVLPAVDISGSGLTITAWVRLTVSQFQPRVVSKASGTGEQDHWWMLGFENGRVRSRVKAGGSTSTLLAASGALALNTWAHVAMTYDGAQIRQYVNGTQVGSMAKSGAVDVNAAVPTQIGRNPDGSNGLTGSLDDVRIYAGALSASDIATLAQAGTIEPEPDPNTVNAGEPFQTSAEHTGSNTDGYRCYLDGSQIGSDLPVSSLINGVIVCSYPGVPAGDHMVVVSAFNATGETMSAPFTVTAVTMAPPSLPPPYAPRILGIVR